MHHADYTSFGKVSKKEALRTLNDSYLALAESQDNWVANLANCSSLLWHCYREAIGVSINWSGFYVIDPADSSKLILGPFMGKVACQTIQIGKGVCGAAAARREVQLVPDVNQFPGHIACDGDTKSEIVVPIVQDGLVRGVLDIDCLSLKGFDETDRELLVELCKNIAKTCKF
ncbi:DEKNAAC105656 [Brettanomyces naardenensis]|uniref:DEKNAAC105656 n=1 Tax=Brettanomyces naardenensis TaxID=13370 RepID=A0A448YTV0_BRENA|nr:DEKNAAC105656 [Brettanomyces naardenensis]